MADEYTAVRDRVVGLHRRVVIWDTLLNCQLTPKDVPPSAIYQLTQRPGSSFPPEPFCSRRGVLSAKAGIHPFILPMYHPRLLSSVSQRTQIVVDRVSFIHAAMTGSTRCHSLSYSTRSSILSASIAFCILDAGM